MFKKMLTELMGKKPQSACDARQRLQIILAHDSQVNDSEQKLWIQDLQKDLMAVIAKYTKTNTSDLNVDIDKQGSLEVLKINVSLQQH